MPTTIGRYLVAQLERLGIGHVFGVPGDFVLRFMHNLARGPLTLVTTCDEQGAGFAADAYARLRGAGAVCVTYGVGGLKIANPVAEAYAERSPVVVISGAPGVGERGHRRLIHHTVRDFETQHHVFRELTCASAVLDNPDTALDEVDRVLAELARQKRPVYLELPRDMVEAKAGRAHARAVVPPASDPETLEIALAESATRIREARRPVIVAGEEVHRFGMQDGIVALARTTGIPVATTILGKSTVSEDDPLFLGVYQGRVGRDEVRAYVEGSDCIVLLGVMMTDINLGLYTARLERGRCVQAVSGRIAVGYHVYEEVLFEDFLRGLCAADLGPAREAPVPRRPPVDTAPRGPEPITIARLCEMLEAFVLPGVILIADTGDAMFGAANVRVHGSAGFLSPAYYASLGFGMPAAIGAACAEPGKRPIVLIGDGAFQMTGMEISTAARLGLDPIVVVLNNGGYTTERYILDGPYNDILPWEFWRIPDLLGSGVGHLVRTEWEFADAMRRATAGPGTLHILDVRLDRMDASPTLRRIAAGLARRQQDRSPSPRA